MVSKFTSNFDQYLICPSGDIVAGCARHGMGFESNLYLITANLGIVAVVVIDGNCFDAPALVDLSARAPRGEGYLLDDSAYCIRNNCQLAASLGRRPCFRPGKNIGATAWTGGIRCWPGAGTTQAGSTGCMVDETRQRVVDRRSRTGSISGSGP